MATKKATSTEVDIMTVERGVLRVNIVGSTPLICNSMSAKARQELLMPAKKKNAAERAASLKHEPVMEFNDSIYRLQEDDAPTLIGMPATAFKGSMRNAAVDIPGSTKAQIGRLTYVPGDLIPVYGIPQLFSSVVRNSDMNKTPDVRTRAIIKHWAASFDVVFTKPLITEKAVSGLLAAAGIMQGLGDWRPEKGKGDYGQYELVSDDDERLIEIMQRGGRQAQIEAMDAAVPYDLETEKLMAWFEEEVERRGLKSAQLKAVG